MACKEAEARMEATKTESEAAGGSHVHYKTLSWMEAGIIMIAETISLGILSLPHVLSTVGLVPGVLLILILGLIATYTGYVVYQFKMEYPQTLTIADGMKIQFGRPGRWIAEVSQDLELIFIMAAHIVIFSVCFNVLTDHALCTTLWMAIAAAVSFLVSLPRTMKGNRYFSMFSCISIATATMIAMISIGITKPIDHPSPTDTLLNEVFAIVPGTLTSTPSTAVAISSIILGFNGHLAYPIIISEMEKPHDFPKALILLETVAISLYIIVAVVIYIFTGQNVKAPAIGSAGPLVRKIAYGFALPTIVVAGVIVALVAAKTLYGFWWKKEPEAIGEKSWRANSSWVVILAIIWVVAWLLACVIPIFSHMIGLIGALFGTWFALGFCSMLWLGMMRKRAKDAGVKGFWNRCGSGWRKRTLMVVNVMIVLLCIALCVLGTYGTIEEIVATAAKSGRRPFSCETNA